MQPASLTSGFAGRGCLLAWWSAGEWRIREPTFVADIRIVGEPKYLRRTMH